jgi:hypothetical protein
MKLTFEQIKENVVEYYLKYADPENIGFLSNEDKEELATIKNAVDMEELECALCDAGFSGDTGAEACQFIIESIMEDPRL